MSLSTAAQMRDLGMFIKSSLFLKRADTGACRESPSLPLCITRAGSWVSLESARAPFDSKIVKVSGLSQRSTRRPSARLSSSFCWGCVHQSRRGIKQLFPFLERDRETDGKLSQGKQPGFTECFFFLFSSPPQRPHQKISGHWPSQTSRLHEGEFFRLCLSEPYVISRVLVFFTSTLSQGLARLSRATLHGSNHLHAHSL